MLFAVVGYNQRMNAITHDDLEFLLARLQAGIGAAELHGSLAGLLSGGGRYAADRWGDMLAIDAVQEALGEGADGARELRQFHEDTAAALNNDDDSFVPMLPDDDAPLALRADALVAWCRGFLGGIGLANLRARGRLSDDGEEAMVDLARIASSALSTEESEEDETAYAEVVEFVRVAAMLLRDECAAAAKRH